MNALGPWDAVINTSCFLLSPLSRGFCYFNSVAIAAKLLQQRLNVSKILIVDWVSKCPFFPFGRAGGRDSGWVSSCKGKLSKSVENLMPAVCKPNCGVLIE